MRKKLTAQGPKDRKSYTVTLPIDWVREHDLDKTREVELRLNGDSISVSTLKDKLKKKIDAEVFSDSLEKVLSIIYRLGVKQVELTYRKEVTYNKIKKIVEERLMGFEIVEHERNKLVVKDLTDSSSSEFEKVLRRIFRLVIEISELSLKGEKFEDLDQSVNKLNNYCKRLLIRGGISDYRKLPHYFSLCQELERFADDIKHRGELNQEVLQLLKESYDLMYDYNARKLNDLFSKINEMRKKSKEENYWDRLSSILGFIYALNFDQ